MNFICCLLLALQAPEAPPDREQVRQWLTRHAGSGCPSDERDPLAKFSNVALEELPSLIKDAEGVLRSGLLSLYGRIVKWKTPARTPSILLNMARAGDLTAAEIVLTIKDSRSHAFLTDGLKRIKAGEATSTRALERLLIDRAGWSHSREAGEILLSMIDDANPERRAEIVDALGNLGYAPALEKLEALAATTGLARQSIDKINYVTGPDKSEALAGQVRGKRMSADFSWYRWALAWIVHLRLTDAVPALREDADEVIRKFGQPKFPADFKAALLHAIHDLGGKLSPEETALLTELGRLPPVGSPPKDVEALAEGFAPAVWAPVEQRRKEAEARNAPPPRIPEDKLPRIMEDRIRFVMNLEPPDPSYLAPNAALAMSEIERLLQSTGSVENEGKLLDAYLYLVRLRDGLKTPDLILQLAQGGAPRVRDRAQAILAAIADDTAEAWYLEQMKGDHPIVGRIAPGRLSSAKVVEALLGVFREGQRLHERTAAMRALADLGCVEILPEVKALTENPIEIREALWRLEIFAAKDRDARLMARTKSQMRSGSFSHTEWGLAQIVRLNLRHLAPELRAWYDATEKKWVSWTDLRAKVLQALAKLGAPVSDAERELIKKSGRGP